MADGIYIDASSFKRGTDAFKKLVAAIPKKVDAVLSSAAEEIAGRAREKLAANATSYKGTLLTHVIADNTKFLLKKITANTPYAAFVEFGTGRYAAEAVGRLPAKYQAFAQQYKEGGNRRSIKGLLFILTEWFHLKGINDKQHAYFIARSIFINGTHAHPYMIPSVIEQEPILIKELTALLNSLHV